MSNPNLIQKILRLFLSCLKKDFCAPERLTSLIRFKKIPLYKYFGKVDTFFVKARSEVRSNYDNRRKIHMAEILVVAFQVTFVNDRQIYGVVQKVRWA